MKYLKNAYSAKQKSSCWINWSKKNKKANSDSGPCFILSGGCKRVCEKNNNCILDEDDDTSHSLSICGLNISSETNINSYSTFSVTATDEIDNQFDLIQVLIMDN